MSTHIRHRDSDGQTSLGHSEKVKTISITHSKGQWPRKLFGYILWYVARKLLSREK